MKKLTYKQAVMIIILLILFYITIDVIMHWDESLDAFTKGFNDMNEINENRNKEHLK